MRLNSSLLFSVLIGFGLALATPAYAEHYDLFSWKAGNDWAFAILSGMNNSTKAAVEIKNQAGHVLGVGPIKSKILSMKEGDSITWLVRPESGMRYPSDSAFMDLQDYALSLGVKLSKPTAKS